MSDKPTPLSQLELQDLARDLPPGAPSSAQAERARGRLMRALSAEARPRPARPWRLLWLAPVAAALLFAALRWLPGPPAPQPTRSPAQIARHAPAPGAQAHAGVAPTAPAEGLPPLTPPPLLAATPQNFAIQPPLLAAADAPASAPRLDPVATRVGLPTSLPTAGDARPTKRRLDRRRAPHKTPTPQTSGTSRKATPRPTAARPTRKAARTPEIPHQAAADPPSLTPEIPRQPVGEAPPDNALDEAAARLSTGIQALRRGQLDQARAAFAELQRSLPAHPLGRAAAYWAIQTALRAEQPRRAQAGMRRYLKLYPKGEHAGELSLLLAEAALREDRIGEAQALLRRAAEDPDPRVRRAAIAQLEALNP